MLNVGNSNGSIRFANWTSVDESVLTRKTSRERERKKKERKRIRRKWDEHRSPNVGPASIDFEENDEENETPDRRRVFHNALRRSWNMLELAGQSQRSANVLQGGRLFSLPRSNQSPRQASYKVDALLGFLLANQSA